MKKKIHCIIQARLGSSRLPGKIFLVGYKKSLIDHLIERVKFSKKINKIIIATPKSSSHDFFNSYFECKKNNIFFGSEDNVLDRYYNCAKKFQSDIIVRITSDCPLTDYRIIDNMIAYFKNNNCDYLSNVHPRYYPVGLDVEIFKFSALKKAYLNAKTSFEKEHVTPYIWNNSKNFRILSFKPKNILRSQSQKYRLTLDYLEDYILISKIFRKLYLSDKHFSYKKIIKYLINNKKVSNINKKYFK